MVALVLSFVAPAFADVNDNFSAYPVGTSFIPQGSGPNPSSWNGWFGSTTNAACLPGAVQSDSHSQSAPNDYAITQPGGSCVNSPFTTTLSLTVNASLQVLKVSWYQTLEGVTGDGQATKSGYSTGNMIFYVYVCPGTQACTNTALYTNDTSTIKPPNTGVPYWNKESVTVTTSKATEYTVTFKVVTAAAAHGNYVSTFVLSSTYVNGGSAVVSGATFFLTDSASGQWFNVTSYAGSYATVTYTNTGTAPTVISSLPAPDFAVNTLGVNLVTVWVGSSYFSQIIPTSSTHQIMWLSVPSRVATYTLNVNDLTGQFGPGSAVYISQGSRVYWSGYLDDQSNMQVWLVPGYYTVELINGANTYTTQSSFAAASGSLVQVQLLKHNISQNCGGPCTITYGASYNSTSGLITISYSDTTTSTSQFNYALYKQNTTGTYSLQAKVFNSGPYGTVTDTYSCGAPNCSSSVVYQFFAVMSWVNSQGSTQQKVSVASGGFAFNLPPAPTCPFGWCVVFPTVPLVTFFTLGMVYAIAAIFGAVSVKFGTIVVAAMTALFAGVGWLPIAPAIMVLISALAVTQFANWLENRT